MEVTTMFSIAGGMALGAGVWALLRGALAAAKSLVRRTKTTKDDAVVGKLEHVVGYLEQHPEVVQALHAVIGK